MTADDAPRPDFGTGGTNRGRLRDPALFRFCVKYCCTANLNPLYIGGSYSLDSLEPE